MDDYNGNILFLTREGQLSSSSNYAMIDDLTYIYEGNKLKSVNDVNNDNHQDNGFSDNGSAYGTDEYGYDANGNMVIDINKHINDENKIIYNYLNLPQQIVIDMDNNLNGVNYLYDAMGSKLRKQTKMNGITETTTDYIGSFVYEDEETFELRYIITPEGRVMANSDGTFEYQYFLKDHLGNTRVTFTETGEVIQEDSYYPFGMAMTGLSYQNGSDYKNKYLYNGKELQDEFGLGWYEYGARFYDAVLGRWNVPDPMAEDYFSLSSYNYVGNNPLAFIDPNGMNLDWFQNEKTGDVYYNSEMRKGDEGTGAMKGEGWKHMGENGMFSDGSPMSSDVSILMQNQNLGNVSMTSNYDKSQMYADAKVTSVTLTGSFKGDNAQKLMGGLGYDFKPVLFKFHSDVTTEYHPEPNGQVTLTHDNSRVEGVLSSRYISQDLVLKNTLTLGTYNEPQHDPPKSFGPMYSISNQSWTVRQNTYGTHAFGRKAGKAINWLNKNTPWRSAYEGLWKKGLK